MVVRGAIILSLLLALPASAQVVRPLDIAIDIPPNRGAAAVWQCLGKLNTRASLIMVTAHPDDEDGGMLAYYSRGQGARVSLLTLNRGEGGANVMSSDFFDALGLVRTMELLEAGRWYGVDQFLTPMIDYGFSKTKEEALGRWTHQRVLYDAVRVVRMTRPLVVTSVFVGGPSDGHGNHQVAGQMAADVFRAAGDPNVFPDQIKSGLKPWKPLKYYARMRSGATDVEVPVGEYNPLLGASYLQLAREGLGWQKSQNGGPSIPEAGKQSSNYRRFGSNVPVAAKESSFFDGIDISLAGIRTFAPGADGDFLVPHLASISVAVAQAMAGFDARHPDTIAPHLAKGMKLTSAALEAVAASRLGEEAKGNVSHELRVKHAQFNNALVASLALTVSAKQPDAFRVALPGQRFPVEVHVANGSSQAVKVVKTWLETPKGENWQTASSGTRFEVTVPANARYTRPYFTRPDIEQPYYDIQDENFRNQPLAPYPLIAWAEFEFEGATFRAGQVVQTTQRVTGLGVVSEPLVTGPAISLSVQPRHGIVPTGAQSFPLTVQLRSNVKGEAQGEVRLELPAGWRSEPASARLSMGSDGAQQTLVFQVFPGKVESKPYEISALAEYAGKQYREGYQITGYPRLRPYFLYRASVHKTAGVDVKVAPGITVGYVTGSGDEVPEALASLGVPVSNISATDDLSRYKVILLGVRAYAAREDLKTHNNRLLEYVKNGGVVIVQYNTPEYDRNYGPYPYVMGKDPEEVTDEASQIEILDPSNPIFNWPNKITAADFEGWVEERGSKFLQSWDSQYTPLLSTHDADQPPQKGGLLFARYGKGIYIYNAYAFYRQLPEGVPGAYRLLANMLSLPARQ